MELLAAASLCIVDKIKYCLNRVLHFMCVIVTSVLYKSPTIFQITIEIVAYTTGTELYNLHGNKTRCVNFYRRILHATSVRLTVCLTACACSFHK